MSAELEQAQKQEVIIDAENAALILPHIGITYRVLLAVAADAYKQNPRRTWKLVYGTVVIGSVRIKDKLLKAENLL